MIMKHLLLRRPVFAWVMYDWANSAYTTLAITVLVAYIQRVVYPSDLWGTTGVIVWAWGISFSMLLGAMLSPVLGSIADTAKTKRLWLGITALSGSAASILLGIVHPSHYLLITCLFVFANLMLELSLGIYDGFLPEIVQLDETRSASAWGYGIGYLGGGLALFLAMLILQYGTAIGSNSMSDRLQTSLVLMGSWWGFFSLPAVIILRDQNRTHQQTRRLVGVLKDSMTDVGETLWAIKRHLSLMLFLFSFLFYNDGVQTVISQASSFALQELAFPESDLMAVILMIQFLAFPGALLVSKLSDWVGSKATLLLCLAVWNIVLVAAYFVETMVGFWWMAAVIAIVLGGTQAVSREVMAAMIPKGESAKYFGFFLFSGKSTSFLGTFSFGLIVALTDSTRMAIVGLIPLFFLGALLLWRVTVPETNLRPKN